jgi:Phage terminase large subunit gpA, ATPase domain
VRCIEVDSASHLYLAGRSMVPTHNTECGNNWIGYVVHQAPGPMLSVQPTVEMAKRNSKQRIDSLIEESSVLRELVSDPRSRDFGNTMLAKEFPGGILVMTERTVRSGCGRWRPGICSSTKWTPILAT